MVCFHDIVRNGICCQCRYAVDTCKHDIVRIGICGKCKSAVNTRRHGLIPFSYLGNCLQLRLEYVGALKQEAWIKSLKEKRLTLVIGLHGTLYDTRRVSLLAPEEKYLTEEVSSRSDLHLSNKIFTDYADAIFKLRPFVHQFLREANKFYKMYVFHLCEPQHAQEVISLLDPEGTYFDRRIITNRDCEMKDLDHVLADERGLVILDDKNVYWWHDDVANLLQIASYHFFRRDNNDNWIIKLVNVFKKTFIDIHDSKSYAEERSDEDAEDGGLVNALELLKQIHTKFFQEENEDSRDVRKLLLP